jgi:peptide/nickel transport system permease protein
MAYFAKKLGMLISLIWVAVTLNFFIPHLMPGNPVLNLIARMKGRVDPRAVHSLMLQFGITNKPLWQQYLQYLWQVLHGHFGISIQYYPTNVTTIIGESLPWTLALVGVATLLAFIIGTVIGIVAAWRRNKWFDTVSGLMWMFLGSVPQFWLALLLLWYCGYLKGWFPMIHSYDASDIPAFTLPFILDILRHAFLPGMALLITSVGGWMLAMRNNMIQVVSDDYVAFARAKGLRPHRIMLTYAARNAILPNVTQLAIALGYAVGGQILIESIFSYPGIGYQLYYAVSNQDYQLEQAIFLIIALVMIFSNFVIDLLYRWLDPRVRVEEVAS